MNQQEDNNIFFQKAKELVKTLYVDKGISCGEVSNIYHKNIDFITQIAINTKARNFYIAIDRIYFKKLFEFNLQNNKSDRSRISKDKSEDNQINSLINFNMQEIKDV